MPVFFFIYLLLICYQDSPTAASIGEIARSPVFLFLPLLLVWHLSQPKLANPASRQFANLLLVLCGGFVLVTILNGFYWFFVLQKGNSYLGENMLVKCVKEVAYFVQFYILFVSSLRFFEYFLPNKLDLLKKTLAAFLGFLLLVLGVELLTMPYAFPFLHAETPYYRIRLLASESSWTGSIIITLGSIYLTLANTKKEKAFGFFFLLVNVLLTGSKMIMVCLPVAFFLIYLRRFNIRKLFLLAALAFAAYWFVLPVILASFTVDLEEYTSVVSRSTSFVTGELIGLKSVIGVGAFYPYYFLQNLDAGVRFVLGLIGFGNTSEVDSWGVDGFKAISGGSTFAHLTMQLGFLGIAFYFFLSRKLFRLSKTNNYLFFAVIYFVISNFFSEIFFMRLTWPLFFAYLCFYKSHEHVVNGTGGNA